MTARENVEVKASKGRPPWYDRFARYTWLETEGFIVGFVIGSSVATAPVQSQLKPEAEPSLAEAQPELPSDGSHISANSGSS